MWDDKNRSTQERLLARAFEECMEEQLSFIPTEREIARLHQFSPEFLRRMKEILKKEDHIVSRKIEKKEFIYGFNKAAACILALLVVGGASIAGYTILGPGSRKEAAPEMSKESIMEEAIEMEEAAPMEDAIEVEEVVEEAVEEETVEEEKIQDATFLGQTLRPADTQELSNLFGSVELILGEYVVGKDTEELFWSIGNREKYDVFYDADPEVEVKIGGYWYTLHPRENTEKPDEGRQMTTVKAGTVSEESLILRDYELSEGAEAYRVVVYVEGVPVAAEFVLQGAEE